MANRARLDWNGEQLIEKLERATRAAIDETLRETDDVASTSHWWRNRTGYGEFHIITESAKTIGTRISGRVGATYSGRKGVRSAFYLLFLEYKTPFLRPAGDITFPTLAEKIRKRLSR